MVTCQNAISRDLIYGAWGHNFLVDALHPKEEGKELNITIKEKSNNQYEFDY